MRTERSDQAITNNKLQSLKKLTSKRKIYTPLGYKDVSDYHCGAYDTGHLSPLSKSASNLDAKVMCILQDWCSDELLNGPFDVELQSLGYKSTLPTNRNLKSLLKQKLGISLEHTFTTNLFPYIKKGNMSAKIPDNLLDWAGEFFALPQIKIICPRITVCFGLSVYNSIRKASGLEKVKTLEAAILTPFKIDEIAVWAQSHPGALGKANRNRGGVDRVSSDWKEMAKYLHKASDESRDTLNR